MCRWSAIRRVASRKKNWCPTSWHADRCVVACDGGTGGYGSVEAMGEMVKDLETWEHETGEGRLIVDPDQKTIIHGETKKANRL